MPLCRLVVAIATTLTSFAVFADSHPRARDLGVPFDGTPGQHNAITDVDGVLVGHSTIIKGEGKLVPGKGPVRTGVTAVLPQSREVQATPLFAGWFSLNGNGEMTGTEYVEEAGRIFGPIMITNTHSVGIVRDAVVKWTQQAENTEQDLLPVVAETLDGPLGRWGGLNDGDAHAITDEHVFAALDSASDGEVSEGSVGGSTGMICNEFKGGIGTSSRIAEIDDNKYTVGVLVQCNYGSRRLLQIAGVPVGREMSEPFVCYERDVPEGRAEPSCDDSADNRNVDPGSIIIVIATDAPLIPHQLKRVARRASLGLGRTGSISGAGSGDIFIAFSTMRLEGDGIESRYDIEVLSNDWLSPLFEATVQATEEAIINSMIAAETMVGADYLRVPGLPHDRLVELLKQYNRYVD